MSKKTRIEHISLAEDERFKNLTRQELMTVVTLPIDTPSGITGKYHMRIQAAEKAGTFTTPKWPLAKLILKAGKYEPKTKRGVFDLIQQSVKLFGEEGVTGEELVRFVYHNVDMTPQRSAYTEGRPCIPWIEDYISGAVTETIGFLVAFNEDGTPFQSVRKK